MSIRQQSKVWMLDLPRNERDVLVILADFADDEGRGARPSIRRIAWTVGISEREVMRCLQWLRDPSRKIIEITKEAGFHKPNVYRLFLERAPQKKALELKGDTWSGHDNAWGDDDEARGDKETEKGDRIEARGDKTPIRSDSIVSPDPLSEPLNKPLAEPLKECAPEIPEREKALALLRIELHLPTRDDNLDRRFAALWEEVPIYELHRKSIYGLLSQKKRRFDFADYETTVRRISQRYQAGMVIGASP